MWKSRARALALGALFWGLGSCQMINLTPITVSLIPSQSDTVVAPGAMIGAQFSEPVVPSSAEAALTLKKNGQNVAVDYQWVGNQVQVKPTAALDPGSRYTLALSGSLTFKDGTVKSFTQTIPFYYSFTSDPPQVLASSPPSGANQGLDSPFILTFSQAMDPQSLGQALSLSPDTPRTLTWSADGKTLTLSPQTTWQALGLYTLKLSSDLKSARGQALVSPWTGIYPVQTSDPAPVLDNLTFIPYTTYQGGGWDPTLALAANPQWHDVLVVHFSQKLDSDDFAGHVNLSPSLTGNWVKTDDQTLVYLAQNGWEMNTNYTLTITSLKGINGCTSALTPFQKTWTTGATIPTQTVGLTVRTSAGDTVLSRGDSHGLPSPVSYTSGTLTLIFDFSQNINAALVAKLASSDLIQPQMPTSAASPTCLANLTSSARQLCLTYDLSPPTLGTQALYLVSLPYGRDSTANDSGSYLAQAASFLVLLGNP